MPVIRMFDGRRIRRTIRVGEYIAIVFGDKQGSPGERILIPMSEYRAGASLKFVSTNALAKSDQSGTEE
jgi:hypothetical protein